MYFAIYTMAILAVTASQPAVAPPRGHAALSHAGALRPAGLPSVPHSGGLAPRGGKALERSVAGNVATQAEGGALGCGVVGHVAAQ